LTGNLNLTLKRPAALCAAVSFMHVLAFGCAVVALSGVPLALVLCGIGLSCCAQLQRLRAGHAADINELICRSDGGLEFAGVITRRRAALVGCAVPSPWLAIIQTRDTAGHREAFVITPDRLGADAFRQLRVWLRWHRVAKSESQN
jgi:hypothetical protein